MTNKIYVFKTITYIIIINKLMKYIIFRDDGIGDLIISTPLIKLLKKYDKDAHITLVCGNRNYEYASLYKKEGLLNNILLNSGNFKIFRKIKFLFLIRSAKPDYTFILNSKNINFLYAKLSGSLKNFGFLTLNTAKNGKIKYRPIKYIKDYLLDSYVTIDCTDNFVHSIDTHWSEYYTKLFKKIFNTVFHSYEIKFSENDLEYVKLNIENDKNNIISILNNTQVNIKNINIIHIDEKWNRSEWSNKDLLNFVLKININTSGSLIITEGIFSEEYNKFIFNELAFNKVSNDIYDLNIYQSKKIPNIYLIKPISMKMITALISISDLVIAQHGGLTHIASMYNKSIIDLTYKGHKNFLKKWHPKSINSIQIQTEDFSNTINNVLEFTKK